MALPSAHNQTLPRLCLHLFLIGANSLAAGAQSPAPQLPAKFPLPANPIELTRAARQKIYFEAVGRKAAIFGAESGTFEPWVFPIKLFHDARISVKSEIGSRIVVTGSHDG